MIRYNNIKNSLHLLFCLGLIILITGCIATEDINKESKLFEITEEVIAFSALSAVSAFEQVESTDVAQETTQTRFNIEEVEAYLPLVNTFMGEDNGFSVEVLDSSHAEYENRMDITIVDFTGDRVTYELHYNETITKIDDDEIESIITGVLIIDGITYQLYGELERDSDEESLEMTARIDDENYVTVNYEIERDIGEYETEFEYEVFQDKQLVQRTEIKFEQEDGETEMSLKFLQGTYESEYDFEIETDDGIKTIEIEYKISESGSVIEEGEYEAYINADGEVIYTRKEIQNKE
ncbi:MAG: hypothetical protein QCH31_11195 [Methanolobus sp.]|nr:hypothetical protein [Methanolobus sp.]